MRVISFLGTLPSKMLAESNKYQEKPQTLLKFAAGAGTCGDDAQICRETKYKDCDVAVMLGWVHQQGKHAPHLALRQEIVDRQAAQGKRVVIADSNLFLYKDKTNPYHYLRYSFDGVFPDTGEYCDQDPDPVRWQIIQQEMGVCLQPWRKRGSHILLCLQRDGGWSMAGFEVRRWAIETITKIRTYTTRPIRIRPHPGDKKAGRYMIDILRHCEQNAIRSVTCSNQESLVDDLSDCWAMVNHNSSPAVAAVIEGVPAFVTDPVHCQAQEVANTDLSLIENPRYPERQHWVERISQFHWSHDDLTSGRCWQHMRRWAQK